MIAFGLFTRLAAFICSGSCVRLLHYARRRQNARSCADVCGTSFSHPQQGRAGYLLCWVFFFMVFYGSGRWSLDALFFKKSAIDRFYPLINAKKAIVTSSEGACRRTFVRRLEKSRHMKHIIALAFIFIMRVLPAQETIKDFGKDRLNSSPRHAEWVDIKSGDQTIKAFVVYPERKDKALAVLVIQRNFRPY